MRSPAALAVSLVLAPAALAQYVADDSAIPSISSFTEQVDFADVDLDGDLDVGLAEGGDIGNQQNRIWINQGGLQGGPMGVFADETGARLPVLADTSRDVEFADIDGDGDVDWYTSNTSIIQNQGSRWWVNLGGKQGGAPGHFADETGSRWVNLGGPGSSIPPPLVIVHAGQTTFVDWSHDSDFGDLDGDGDLDLVHSSYGPGFFGKAPTRIFLNDGEGRFEEFNPSGFQLVTADIENGIPGLWCDGVQRAGTTDVTGTFCDIATSATDLDVGDIDGDFDLDILLGARQELPRMFANRLDGSPIAPAVGGGQLGFRDVTGMVFPPGYAVGNGHYEQEMGDLDRDGDLDVLGVNWVVAFGSFHDVTLENSGQGTFLPSVQLQASGSDDYEGDFGDYDNDGDLDIYMASFDGQDRLYRNQLVESGTSDYSFTMESLLPSPERSLDAEFGDTDGDGDLDVLIAVGIAPSGAPNRFLRNVTETPDVHPPYLPHVEDVGDQTASPAGVPARVHVYDNVPYYLAWYHDTAVELSVDGVALPEIAAASSLGQVFRGVLPGNLFGSVDYRFRSTDASGNAGLSATRSYVGSFAGTFQTPYGSGTSGASGGEPVLRALSVPFAGTTLHLAASSGAPAGTTALVVVATQKQDPGVVLPGLLKLHVGGNPLVVAPLALDAAGDAVASLPLGAVPSGATAYAQAFVLDGTASGEAFASSKGLEIAVP